VTDVEIVAGAVEANAIEGLSDLVEQDFLGAKTFERALEEALSRLAEPVEDRTGSHRPREGVLVVQRPSVIRICRSTPPGSTNCSISGRPTRIRFGSWRCSV
jgi:hypothetical protein